MFIPLHLLLNGLDTMILAANYLGVSSKKERART